MKFINNKDKVGSSLILLFSLAYLNATFDVPLNPILGNEVFTARTLPMALSVAAIIVSLIHIFLPVKASMDETISRAVVGFQWPPCLLLVGLMLAYGLTFEFFGFVVGTFPFLLAGFSIMQEKRYYLSALVSAGLVVFMWALLTQLFDIYLDVGNLYRLTVGE